MKTTKFIVVATLALMLAAGITTTTIADTTPMAGVTTIAIKLDKSGYRASKLLGSDVYNDKEQNIGTIDDLIVNSDAAVSVAVVSVGGFLGLDVHHVAVPTDKFEVDSSYTITLPGATEKALKAAPQFTYAK